jgi:hypothetical protein
MGITTTQIAQLLGMKKNELRKASLRSFLLEKKRETLQAQIEILSRYGATSLDDLEAKIADGLVAEHPAWEDLIVAENLSARLEEYNAYLGRL